MQIGRTRRTVAETVFRNVALIFRRSALDSRHFQLASLNLKNKLQLQLKT
jgi:hypothetical protein